LGCGRRTLKPKIKYRFTPKAGLNPDRLFLFKNLNFLVSPAFCRHKKRGSIKVPDEAAITQLEHLCDTHQLAYRYMDLKTALSIPFMVVNSRVKIRN